jgi:hypothetical protein
MVEVQAQEHLRDHVDRGDPGHAEAVDDVRVHVGVAVRVLAHREAGEREVREVEEHVERERRAAVAHGEGGVGRGGVLARAIADRARTSRADDEREGRHDVQGQADEQRQAHAPEERRVALQRGGVGVERRRPQEELEIPQHVHDHEAVEHGTGDRDHGLLADGGVVERERLLHSFAFGALLLPIYPTGQ